MQQQFPMFRSLKELHFTVFVQQFQPAAEFDFMASPRMKGHPPVH